MKKTQGIWIIAVLFIAITTFGIGTQKTTRTTTSNSTNTSTKTLKRYDRNDHWGAWCGSVVSAFGRMATNNFDKKFNYNRITDAPKPTSTPINGVHIERNGQGAIIHISDGKSPLILGSIPSQETNIHKLRDEFGLSDVAIIKVYTLNRPFERNWSGLAKLV
ncbi:MAG: hypothetical protein NTX86_05060, partial [Candidatus Dependentiae bacterium]|nr:hypothetical protein [Candidatus Dependentiae bacterium]